MRTRTSLTTLLGPHSDCDSLHRMSWWACTGSSPTNRSTCPSGTSADRVHSEDSQQDSSGYGHDAYTVCRTLTRPCSGVSELWHSEENRSDLFRAVRLPCYQPRRTLVITIVLRSPWISGLADDTLLGYKLPFSVLTCSFAPASTNTVTSPNASPPHCQTRPSFS